MTTFNNKPELKKELVEKLQHHQELDTFIQGTWLTDQKVEGNGFKGCFYGCTMQTKDHPIHAFSEYYHVDLWYCYLTEKIFEGLPDGEYQKFPLQSIEVLPVGFDFDQLKSDYHKAFLLKQLDWVENVKVRECLVFTSELFYIPFSKISESAARSARSAAWSAESAARSAESAARSAAESAAWSARSAESAARSAESAAWSARSAAWSAAWSAESAAWSAESAAGSADGSAKQNHYIWLRDTLFTLINNNTNDNQ